MRRLLLKLLSEHLPKRGEMLITQEELMLVNMGRS
jgi:hypothetical protein